MTDRHIKAKSVIHYWDCPKCEVPCNSHDEDVTNGEIIIYATCNNLVDNGEASWVKCGFEYTVEK